MNLSTKNLLITITGFVLILDLTFEIISFLQMVPFNNLRYFLSNYQSIWITALLDIFFCFILVVLCFFKKYFVFPILLICSIYTLNGIILNLNEVLHYGFIYPIDNLTGIIGIPELILSLFGTFYWFNQLNKFRKINFGN